MTRFAKLLTFLLALTILLSPATGGRRASAASAQDQVVNVGHRGASGYAPEHTLVSYDLALTLGADYIEQDLQLTKDGVLVALHDDTLDRTARGPAANCKGLVIEKTLAQIKTCDVGTWFNEAYPQYAKPEYAGLTIPTLDEVFARYGKRVNYYIETKNPEAAPGMEEKLLALMEQYGLRKPAAEKWQVLIQSFSPSSLLKIHHLDPSLPLIQLFFGSAPSSTVQAQLNAASRYAVGIGPRFSSVDAALVSAAHARCLDIHPYTVNEKPLMQSLIALGVDGMFTNFPDRLDEVLGSDAVKGARAAKRAADAHEECRNRRPELEKRAVLPADTFAEGPVSGTFITPTPPLRTPPFPSQPVQGVSAVNRAGEDEYWAMPDNGYGAKTNSADFLLRVYRLRPNFKTDDGGRGTVAVKGFISLRDPDKKVPFAITNESTADRLLTGADFDIESFRIDRNGDLWFGEEFGPYLLHTDRTGKLIDAPIPLAGVKSPENPTLAPGEAPNLPGSRGFEAMAISKNSKYLYPMLEGALTTDADQRRRTVYEFDIAAKRYTGKTLQYRVESPEHATGDMTAFDGNRLLVIERDNLQGPAARFKKLYLIDLRRTDAGGFLVKREVADLLAIEDPDGVSLPPRTGDYGIGDPFSFPFQTIESVLPLSDERVLLINDNNYPFSAGRNPARPDDTEMIVIRIPNLDDIQVGGSR